MRPAWTVGFAALFLMLGYELVRSPSTMLFQAAYGTRNLAVIQAASPLCILAMLYGYGLLLGRLGSRRTLFATTLLSGGALAALWAAIRVGWAPATALLFAFREGYIVLLGEQYWSFLNSTLDQDEAKRWNGVVCGLGSIGSIAGGWCVAVMTESLGTGLLPLLAAASVLPAAFVTDLAYARFAKRERVEPDSAERVHATGPLGFAELRRTPTLVLIVTLVFLSQSLTAVLGLAFQERLHAEVLDMDRRTALSGWFYSGVAGFAGLMQFVGAPLLLRWVSPAAILVAVPAVHVAAAGAMLAWTSLASAGAALMLFKVLDYSLFRVTKEMLYIPLSFEARYRAKETIDAFGYRFSGGLMSLVAYMLQRASGAGVGLYGLMAAALSSLWLAATAFWALRDGAPATARANSLRR